MQGKQERQSVQRIDCEYEMKKINECHWERRNRDQKIARQAITDYWLPPFVRATVYPWAIVKERTTSLAK